MPQVMALVVKQAARGCPAVVVTDLPGVLRVTPFDPRLAKTWKAMDDVERVAHALAVMVNERRRVGLPL
jgi:hypothetical protein